MGVMITDKALFILVCIEMGGVILMMIGVIIGAIKDIRNEKSQKK
jgi:hypothetical protein